MLLSLLLLLLLLAVVVVVVVVQAEAHRLAAAAGARVFGTASADGAVTVDRVKYAVLELVVALADISVCPFVSVCRR